MEYTILPGTDLKVSRVCLGTMQFSGSAEEGTVDITWGQMSQEEVNDTVSAALEAGINFFDCAEAYGANNCAERAVGVALKGRREQAVISSKFGKHLPLWECDDMQEEEMYAFYGKKEILAAVDRSLAALQTNYIDLYQIHWPVNVGLLSKSRKMQTEVVEALEQAKSEGKIKFYGVCNFGTEDLSHLMDSKGKPCTNQICYNLLWRSIEYGILPFCRQKDIGILCYSPLQQGLLGGRYTAPGELPEGRRRTRIFSSDSTSKSRHGWAGGAEAEKMIFDSGGILAVLKDICQKHGIHIAEVSTAWCLAQPGVSCVLVGASNKEQVLRNAKIPKLSQQIIGQCSEVTDSLKALIGNQVDQYAAISRIHGN